MTRSLFSAYDPTHGSELWITDGTAAGTSMVLEINPSGDSAPSTFAALGASALFTAFDGVHGFELWITDGSAAGTSMVKDISPTGSSQPKYPHTLGSRVVFVADDGTHGLELWVSNGTEPGTYLLKDINPGAANANRIDHFSIIPDGDKLLFWADDGTHGKELWVTDGTSGGTSLLKDINPGSGYSKNYFPGGLTVGTHTFFRATDGTHGEELWVTDGTADGTSMLKEIRSGSLGGDPKYFTAVGSLVVFAANDGTHGYELWATDGTSAGTSQIADINPGAAGAPREFTPVGGRLLFVGNDGSLGAELWSTDGTSAGTSLLKDIRTGAPQSAPARLTAVGNRVLFSASDGAAGYELWASDGTAEGTTLVADIRPGASGSYPASLSVFGTNLLFSANDGTHGTELWISDGTGGGTSLVADINPGAGPGSEINFFTLADSVACFREGTRIMTVAGERAVESLRAGDLVPTLFGGEAPIVWIGHRAIDCRRHPRPDEVRPIRVRRDAFGPGSPNRDLDLSPDHAVFVDGVLIPVRYLVNGTSVVRIAADVVRYFHIELDHHDVLWAEGLTAESWLDTGDRANFSNGGPRVMLHPNFASRAWEALGCAPLVVTGPLLAAARARLDGVARGMQAATSRKLG